MTGALIGAVVDEVSMFLINGCSQSLVWIQKFGVILFGPQKCKLMGVFALRMFRTLR